MRTLLRICRACARYTLRDACPSCGAATAMPLPARYSPEDRYGKYRRRLRKEGERPWTAS
ncbi:MAG TPA: RNA-protein complex protein Nop10 [Thermoplasmata archaeon]|nr:RNA-protein complex protein Nop10 [Thermoplasmata archaeon]